MKSISRKRWISIGVTVGLVALLWAASAAVAQKPSSDDLALGTSSPLTTGGGPSEGMSFSYQGRLAEGETPANGYYDFIIDLYDNPTVGSALASCTNTGTGSLLSQPVQNGLFAFYLYCGSSNSSVFTGGERWVQVQVRRTGTATYTMLPRQPISPAPYAFSLYPWATISSTAFGGNFGNAVLNIHNKSTIATSAAFHAKSVTGSAVHAESANGSSIYSQTENGYAIYGYDGGTEQARGYGGYFFSANGVGVYGRSNALRIWSNQYAPGVYGSSYDGVGVYGTSASSASWIAGVYGEGTGEGSGVWGASNGINGYGGFFSNGASGVALYASGSGSTRSKATLRVNNYQTSGGMAAYLTNDSNYHTAHFYNANTGGVLYLQNGGTGSDGTGGGDFITALNKDENDIQFKVTTSGEVYADGGYHCGKSTNCWYTSDPADFAEVLPAANEPEPGDVLVINMEGRLVPSTKPYQTSVMGIYSTRPMYVGNSQNLDQAGYAPLAIVGVVPVKVSAENGPIYPGDLLVASSTPGHAMKAGLNPPVGTVIGKALESLKKGQGAIQMLVTLQ